MKVLFLAKTIDLWQELLGIMSLSASLKRAGHETCAIDIYRTPDLRAEIERIAPDMLAYSLVSNNYVEVLRVNREIKTWYKGLSVFGGPHPTYFPEMVEEEGVDVVCRGEGDEAIVDLANAVERGEDITGIANLWVKRNGQVFRNELRPLVEDLDTLPFPDRDLVLHLVEAARGCVNFVMASRGCPFDCSYCFNHLLRKMAPGKYVRRRSVGNFIEELKAIKAKLGTRVFSFQDDIFAIDLKWLEEFAQVYPREIGLPYMCHGRAGVLTEPIAEVLARSGCVMVVVGLENGNNLLRREVLEKTVTSEDILRTAQALHKYCILLMTQNMVGIPDETRWTALQTIDLNYRCQTDTLQVNHYTPHPATRLGRYALEKGYFDGAFDTLPENFHLHEEVFLNLPDKEDILALSRLAHACLDFRHFLTAVKIVSRFPRFLRRPAYAALEKKAEQLHVQGRGYRHTLWRSWDYLATLRNPYMEQGAVFLESRRGSPGG